jgi:cytochrome c oxidase subunit 1
MANRKDNNPEDGEMLTVQRKGWLRRYVFSTDHHIIGIQYLLLALMAVGIGTLLSVLMRIHLVWPNAVLPFWGIMKPEDYLALVTMHGTMMMFFVMTTAPQSGFGNLVLPLQIGTREMALPVLNAVSFWLTAVAFLVLLAATFVPGGAPISGWTSYPPLSAIASAGPGQGLGMDLWLASIGIFCIAATLGAVNTLTTIVGERCEGMTWMRLPLTVWSWFVAAILSILAFSVLLAALLLLFCDRHAGTSFFIPAGDLVNGTLRANADGSPLLWLHLFWFFGHPEVYITVLPGMGITSMLLANFTRRPVFAYRMMIATTLLIGMLGLVVWGHHMFVSGMNPFAGTAFALTTMAIALPSSAKVLSWLATIWQGNGAAGRPRMATPMLFSLGFVSFFITGGLTGPILAQPVLDSYLHNTFFVVAHFHLIMAMAAVFSMFAATYYWFPLMTGRRMHEGLGKWHFWTTLLGAYATFLPMHLAGLAGEPRQYAQLTGIPGVSAKMLEALLPLQKSITYTAIFLACAQLLFLANILWSMRRGKPAGENPWRATTLEWAAVADGKPPVVHRGPCDYGTAGPLPFGEADYKMQWEPDGKRE